MEAISKEVYEYVRAQVLAEQKARRKESERQRQQAYAMFDELKEKFFPRLICKYTQKFGNRVYDAEACARRQIENAEQGALYTLGERNCITAYKHGKAEEANEIASQILEEVLKAPLM